jgi:hypothetical protein
MLRSIVIGDIHGCLDEFDELLRTVSFNRATDHLVLLGDLVDRGPDPVGVVRRARELRALAVLGNHEEKHLRWRRHEAKRAADASYTNPMRPFTVERLAQHHAFSEDDWSWIAALPITLAIDEDWVAVHAGFEPLLPLSDQRPEKMLRIRYVDATGKMKPIHNDTDQPEGTHRWATRWGYPHHIAYGHHAMSFERPHVDRYTEQNGELYRVALDTGCCFGGALSAMILPHDSKPFTPEDHFASVKARGTYAQPWAGDNA